MASEAPDQSVAKPKPKRINLRRPDIMEQVKAQVLTHYRSDLVDRLRTKGEVTCPTGQITIKLAKEFGFATASSAASTLPTPRARCSLTSRSIFWGKSSITRR